MFYESTNLYLFYLNTTFKDRKTKVYSYSALVWIFESYCFLSGPHIFTKRKADKPFRKECILTKLKPGLKFVGPFWLKGWVFFNMNQRKYLKYWRNIHCTKAARPHKMNNNLNIYLILNILQWFEQAGFFKRAFSSASNLVYCVPSYDGACFSRSGDIQSRVCLLNFCLLSQLGVQLDR